MPRFSSGTHDATRSIRPAPRAILPTLLLVLTLAIGGAGLTQGLAAPGDTRSDPAPLGTEVVAGPWRLTVAEVVTGEAATEQVLAASSVNEPPRDGFTYVAVRIVAVNEADRPLEIGTDDFALTGGSGLVRRFTGVFPPDPALDGVAEPGESREGWVILGAPVDEENMLLIYDSISLTGTWADRIFALTEGATVANAEAAATEPNDIGVSPDDPAGIGDVVATGSWQIELIEIASCQEVYDMSDFRVQALPVDDSYDAAPWVALNIRVTNNQPGGNPAFLSPTALMLAEPDGSVVSDVITLTAPTPDASGAYYPGASREGWVAFELPATYADAGTTLVRFLPYQGETDERFITFGENWTDCRQ